MGVPALSGNEPSGGVVIARICPSRRGRHFAGTVDGMRSTPTTHARSRDMAVAVVMRTAEGTVARRSAVRRHRNETGTSSR